MANHTLRTPEFKQIKEGQKTFGIRYENEQFNIGDIIQFLDFDHINKVVNGSIDVEITYLATRQFGLDKGFCAFGFKKVA